MKNFTFGLSKINLRFLKYAKSQFVKRQVPNRIVL